MSADAVPLLPRLFDETAARHPDRVAVDVPEGRDRPYRQTVTYAQLRRQADGIARALSAVARRDAVVAILLGRETPDVYAAQLGVMKAGCAYTCLDPAFPDDHVRRVLEDADPVAVVTDRTGRARIGRQPPGWLIVDPAARSAPGVSLNGHDLRASDLAYVIYTSGTTGRPKGVMIEHRGIGNLVASDVDYFGLTCHERVAQCSSPAYDSSIEETWLAFAVGATLVPLDYDTVRLGPDLVPWLRRERITVFCPPPTLLRSMDCSEPHVELPDMKLVYVGGEALPADLADLWSSGIWLENGYGPTECSVTVVRGRVRPGEPVTIGWPVRNHRAFVLGESLEELPDGEPGELCLAGPGLARGYHRQDEVTAAKFPEHPIHGRIYRTGDLVRRNGGSSLEYLGRIDGQVKLRGYRIELAAVEAHLVACPGVRAAACRVQGSGPRQILAALVVPVDPAAPPAVDELRSTLRLVLPDYMVPARIGFLDELPTTVGGKLDRKALPEIAATNGNGRERVLEPRSDDERLVAQAFARALHHEDVVSVDDDFFLDLGGDSLAAVSAVCELRTADGSDGIATVRDLYETRTAAKLAARMRQRRAPLALSLPPRGDGLRPGGRPGVVTFVQAAWIAVKIVVSGAALGVGAFTLLPWALQRFGVLTVALAAPFAGLLAFLVRLTLGVGLTVALKRALIGRYVPTRAPVWGSFHVRHWMVVAAAQSIPWRWIEGTPLLPVVLRRLGADIGHRVYIHRGVDLQRGGWDLLTIGDDVTLAQDCGVRLVELDDGQIVVGRIRVECGATLDVRAGLSPDTVVGSGSHLTPLSWLPPGGRMGEYEQWCGVPAARCGTPPSVPPGVRGAALSPAAYTAAALGGRVVSTLASWLPALAVVGLAAAFRPDLTSRVLDWLARPSMSWQGLALVTAGAFILVTARLVTQALAMRVMGPVAPGVVNQWSLESLRIWTKTGLVDQASRWLSGGLFWPHWLRLAGMRIGRDCEISTLIDVLPERVSIGHESFFADGIYFCAPWRLRGTITVADTSLGPGTFLGNHSVIPAGHAWPAGMFIGVGTVADAGRVGEGTAWFGLPPMELPRREIVEADRHLTHNPGTLRYVTRLFWETLRLGLPIVPLVVAFVWYVTLLRAGRQVAGPAFHLLAAPLVTLGAGAALVGAVLVLKWVLLGQVRPAQHPLWSCWCSRWDFLYVAWNQWARHLLSRLEGTLMLNAVLRLMGMRIGRGVVLGPGFSQVVDPDMLTFEDGATVACDLQAHTFEDRILKIDRVRVRRGATVGHHTVVFYGADVGERAYVAPQGIVMKRDVLEPDRLYVGSPTRAVE